MKLVLRGVVGLLLTVGASALIACGSSDAGGGNAGAAASSNQGGAGNSLGGSSNAGGTNSGGNHAGGGSQGGNHQGGSNQGGTNQGGNNQGGNYTGGGSQGGSGGGSCEGDFTLGQHVVTSGSTDTMGQPCNNKGAPTNCPDGTFIEFPSTNECICIVMCSSLQGVKQGDACTTDGKWMCEKVKATNASANTATVCVPTAWGLCTSGGTGQGGSGGGGQGGSGGGQAGSGGDEQGGSGGGSQCGGQGADCFDDNECCSGTCESFNCA